MIYLSDVDNILQDFYPIWFTNCESRYRGLKGARETGKSFNFIGEEPLFKLLSDSRRNAMMVRQNYKDNSSSTYLQIKSAARRLGISHLFNFTKSPYLITRKDTGQVIMFAGMNDVENITSTTVETGFWTDLYFEEASQLESYEDFRVVDGSLRLPNTPEADGLFCQITFCFNAWDVGHWLYDIFFKDRLEDNIQQLEDNRYQFAEFPDFNIGYGYGLALHISSYKCNSYRRPEKDESMEILKKIAYDIYKVEGLGCWGHLGDSTYPYFTDDLMIKWEDAMKLSYCALTVGIDIGGTNGENKVLKENYRSAMTMELSGLTSDKTKLVSLDEFFYTNEGKSVHKDGPEIADDMINKLYEWYYMYPFDVMIVYVESADPGDFQGLLRVKAQQRGLRNIRFINSTKNKIQSRVDFDNLLHAYKEHLFTERVTNLIREYKNAKKDEEGHCRGDGNDHALNGSEYSWIPLLPQIKRYKLFKER